MFMKKLPALLLSTLSIMSLALPASAQHANSKGGFYNYKPGDLQKVEKRHYKGEIQIIDDTPDVKDFRRPKESGPTYQINLAPLPNSEGGGVGVNGGGSGGGRSPVINLTPTRDGRLLAPAGMESNMNSLKAPSQKLLPGTSTGVHSNIRPSNSSKNTKPSSLTSKSGKHDLLNRTNAPKIQNVPSTYKEYEKINSSGASKNSSSTSLTGEMKTPGRGTLLKKTN